MSIHRLSFALAYQNKNKEAHNNNTSAPSHHAHVFNSTTDYPSSIVYLHRTIGNQAVERLMRSTDPANGFDFAKISIQPKLKVSQPGDEYEQEADRIAEQVMRMSSTNQITGSVLTNTKDGISRRCSSCEMKKGDEEEENLKISRKASTTSGTEACEEATNKINNVLSSGGSSLDNDTKDFMESRFGYDFRNVRIHKDERAAGSAQSVNSSAYTVGQDIVFDSGQYAPRTVEGRKMLAHELTHVVRAVE